MFSSLGRIYDFEKPSYLEANQSGTITREQKDILGSQPAGWFGLLRYGKGVLYLFLVPFLGIFLAALLLSQDVEPLLAGLAFAGVLGGFLVLLLIRWLNFRRWKRTLQEELKMEKLQQGLGKLEFGRSHYFVNVDQQKLRLPFLSKGTLQPGLEYRFYYLPESKTVLSADNVRGSDFQNVNQGLTVQLAELNHLRLDCLPENQAGRLHLSQYSLLVINGLTAILLLIVPVGVFYSQRSNFGWDGSVPTLNSLLGMIQNLNPGTLIAGAVLLLIFGFGVYRIFNLLWDLLTGRVIMTEGIGSVEIKQSSDSEGSSSSSYFYVIGDQKFKVRKRAFFAFEPGKTYRAYYTPRTKTLVNLEVIE